MNSGQAVQDTRFANRREAGRLLADALRGYAHRPDVIVLALPRGGVPVASEIASVLHAPLDVLVVRKLGVPGHEELAMGAVASGGVTVLNQDIVSYFRIPASTIDRVSKLELAELARRSHAYRGDAPPLQVHGRTVIVVDDGLATGATMSAAVQALRAMAPRRIIVATPVSSRDAKAALGLVADEFVSVLTPEPFDGVGRWYDDFGQTSDREVQELLAASQFHSVSPEVPS